MIETEGLSKRFGDLTAVDEVTLRVGKGEVFGFLGPNGAGKTTTVRMLAGLIAKSAGTARVAGHEVGVPAENLALRRAVGFLPENVGLYEELSAERNLTFYARLYGLSPHDAAASVERLLRSFGLWEDRLRPVGGFSKGMKQKVALARALVHDPEVLFLDEPTANLDPEATRTVRETILARRKEGRTVFLTTHNLDEAQRTCDRVAVMNRRLVSVGSPDELRARLPVRTVEVVVREVTARLTDALARWPTEVSGTRLVVTVRDADRETPEIVDALVRADAAILRVAELTPTLEDAYLAIVRGS